MQHSLVRTIQQARGSDGSKITPNLFSMILGKLSETLRTPPPTRAERPLGPPEPLQAYLRREPGKLSTGTREV